MTLIDYVGEVVDQCAREILKYTPQLYTKEAGANHNITPEPDSSGVLLQVKEDYFLITAGHVIKNDPANIGIMIDNIFHVLNGEIKYINPSESVQGDKIDIAVWRLNTAVVEDLKKKYSFLPFEKIDFEHKIDSAPKYLIVGFPWKETVKDFANKKLIVKPFIFLTKESEKPFYKRFKFEEHSNLLLDYRQKKVKNFANGNVQQNKSPQGISGCGVWHIPNFFMPNGDIPDIKLVGQIIEQNDEKTVLISTRIHLVTELLRNEFGLDIPISKITRLK